MKVSVIVPAHNEEERIGVALKALTSQDYSDLEIIVVDNASTDQTQSIAKTFPVTVLYETRKGTNFALECGRRAASGEVIVRVDADCVPEKDWVSRGIRHFNNPKVVGVTGPYDHYDGGWFFRWTSLVFQQYLYRFLNWLCQLFNLGAMLIGGNSMMRASALKKIGGFDTSFTFYGDDTDTAKKLSKLGYVVCDPKLIMKTSARRYKKQGTVKLFLLYSYHFFKVIFARSKKVSSKKVSNKYI